MMMEMCTYLHVWTNYKYDLPNKLRYSIILKASLKKTITKWLNSKERTRVIKMETEMYKGELIPTVVMMMTHISMDDFSRNW